MRHNSIKRPFSLKALGFAAALLILFGGMAKVRPAYAEEENEENGEDSFLEEPFDGEYIWDEDDEYSAETAGYEYGPEEDERDEEVPEDGGIEDAYEADDEDEEDEAEDSRLTVEGGMAVFSARNEAYLRETDGSDDEPDEDEFLSFYVDIKSDGPEDAGGLPAYYRVDGGIERPFSDVLQEEGNETRYHIDLQDMAEMDPGLHEIEVYVNDEVVHTDRFYVARDWDEIMTDPSEEQISAVSGKGRSPYVVYYPQFENTAGITEYAIDFAIDDMNRGT